MEILAAVIFYGLVFSFLITATINLMVFKRYHFVAAFILSIMLPIGPWILSIMVWCGILLMFFTKDGLKHLAAGIAVGGAAAWLTNRGMK